MRIKLILIAIGISMTMNACGTAEPRDCKYSKMNHIEGYEYNPCGRYIRKMEDNKSI